LTLHDTYGLSVWKNMADDDDDDDDEDEDEDDDDNDSVTRVLVKNGR